MTTLAHRAALKLGIAAAGLGACLTAAVPPMPAAEAQSPAARQGSGLDPSFYRSPDKGGVRRWQVAPGEDLDLRAAPSLAAGVVSSLPEGTLLANLGCSEATDGMWCEVRAFRSGVAGFAPAGRLLPAQGPDGIVPLGMDDSRQRARKRDFDGLGEIPCAQERGQALGTCRASVARGSGGDATVVVTFQNGFTRQLYFVHGEFVSASATMSGTGSDTDWRLEGGLHFIRVDDQRYELPDTLVFAE